MYRNSIAGSRFEPYQKPGALLRLTITHNRLELEAAKRLGKPSFTFLYSKGIEVVPPMSAVLKLKDKHIKEVYVMAVHANASYRQKPLNFECIADVTLILPEYVGLKTIAYLKNHKHWEEVPDTF
jgi:hypothetical protein